MGCRARLRALAASCGVWLAVASCAINPQPEPPVEAVPGTSGAGGADAGSLVDSGVGGSGGGSYTGGAGGTSSSGSGGAYTGGTGGGSAGSGGSANAAVPGAFDESYVDDDALGARTDAVNQTGTGGLDSGVSDADSGGDADEQ